MVVICGARSRVLHNARQVAHVRVAADKVRYLAL